MPLIFSRFPLVFAAEGGGAGWVFGVYILGLFLLYYWVLHRPQKQQERRRREMLDALKKNDKVVTTGGIFGTVVSIDASGERVVLRIDDEKGVRVTFGRSSVARVLDPTAEKSAEA